ncbi:hypothetical protein CTI12_AA163790 [Artemisia annua]|uniref:Uncharacterized protein n=1 Tax=Artemisia annua TaxID=35608 RepID=A0A2U1PDV7_ARTAN|nr:hypothetical protein CTI12_AA163790 [Artemisia annua]
MRGSVVPEPNVSGRVVGSRYEAYVVVNNQPQPCVTTTWRYRKRTQRIRTPEFRTPPASVKHSSLRHTSQMYEQNSRPTTSNDSVPPMRRRGAPVEYKYMGRCDQESDDDLPPFMKMNSKWWTCCKCIGKGRLVCWPVVGSIVSGLAYGFLDPVFGYFKAVGEGCTAKFRHCLIVGARNTIKWSLTFVKDLTDVCLRLSLYSYFSMLDDLRVVYVPIAILVGWLGVRGSLSGDHSSYSPTKSVHVAKGMAPFIS